MGAHAGRAAELVGAFELGERGVESPQAQLEEAQGRGGVCGEGSGFVP
jgi:hypothetical protein